MNRYARRPPRRTMGADSNTDELLNHAEALGLSCALIEDRDGCPEVLVGGWGGLRLAEIKTRKGKLRKRQEDWRAWWRGPPPSLWRTTADVERTVAELRQEAEWRRSVAFETATAEAHGCAVCGYDPGAEAAAEGGTGSMSLVWAKDGKPYCSRHRRE